MRFRWTLLLGVLAVVLPTMISAPGTAAPAQACDHARVIHSHCGHCHWVPGHHGWTWQIRYVWQAEIRRVVCGYRSVEHKVPTTREVYDVTTDTYVDRVDYEVRTVSVPEYRDARVSVCRPQRVRVQAWIPGHWVCRPSCCLPPPGCDCRPIPLPRPLPVPEYR